MDIHGKNELEVAFPKLLGTPYTITSPKNTEYNCIAWAVGEDQVFWWPDEWDIAYWPEGVPREETQEAFIQAYGTLGYETCDNNINLEEGYEKVAIYVDDTGKPKHAARQLSSGLWTSKLGQSNDIEHTLDGLTNSIYGQVGLILKRKIQK